MSRRTKSSPDLTSGRLLPQIILFSLPLAATGVLQLLFNAADVIVVGKFDGSNALAAVGSSAQIVSLIVGAILGASVGVNILVARYIGAQEPQRIHRAVHSAIALSILLGIVMFAVGQLASDPLLRLIKVPDEIFPISSRYLRIYFCGLPALFLYNFGAAILRAYGDTQHPLLFLTVSGVINVGLNLIFVIVCKLSVAGVAIATCISQYVSVVLVLRCLCRLPEPAKLQLDKLRLSWDEVVRMCKIGFPAAMQSVIFNISNLLIQSSVNSFGTEVIAANTAAANIDGFAYIAMDSVYHAALTFTSQNLGAKNLLRIKRTFWDCMLTVLAIGIPICVGIWYFSEPLLSIYVSKSDPSYAAVLDSGYIRICYVALPYFLCGMMEVGCGMVRGLGKSWLPMIVSTVGACVLRIIWIYTIFQKIHTLPMLYVSYPISWIVTTSIHLICFVVLFRKISRSIASPVEA